MEPEFQTPTPRGGVGQPTPITEMRGQEGPRQATAQQAPSQMDQMMAMLRGMQQEIQELKSGRAAPQPSQPASQSTGHQPQPTGNHGRAEARQGMQDNAAIDDSTMNYYRLLQKEISQFNHKVRSLLTDKCRVTLTGKDNFEAWSIAIRADADLIKANDVFTLNQPPTDLGQIDAEVWYEKTELIRARMLNAMTSDTLNAITSATSTACELWDQVCLLFGKSRAEERLTATRELFTLRIEGGGYLTYQRKFQKLQNRLFHLGCPLPDSVYHDAFIIGLENYQRQFVKTRLDDFYSTGRGEIVNLDLKELMAQLTNRVSTKSQDNGKKSSQSSANAASLKKGSNGNSSSDKDKDKSSAKKKCLDCGRTHGGAICFEKHPDKAPNWWPRSKDRKNHQKESSNTQSTGQKDSSTSTAQSTDMVVYGTAQNAVLCKATAPPPGFKASSTDWLLDSCASFHVTPDRSAFMEFHPYDPTSHLDSMINANGGITASHGIGTVVVSIGGGTMVIQDVRYNPQFFSNLISLGQLLDQNFSASLLDNKDFLLTSPNGSQFEAQLRSNDNIFVLTDCLHSSDAESTARPVVCAAVKIAKTSLSMIDWHRRLAHLGAADILRLASDPASPVAISGPKELPFCETCVKAKMTRSYSKKARTRMTAPLARIHMDIVGGGKTLDFDDDEPIEASRAGAKYALIIVDDATRYRWVLYLRGKSDALPAFRHWLQQMKNQGFSAPAFIVSDNEFKSHEWNALRSAEGIEWTPANPHSQWQDGVPERSIRLLFERTRAVIIDAGLPFRFWQDALNHVRLATNYLPTSTVLYNNRLPAGTNADKAIQPSQFKSPISVWCNDAKDISFLRRWGCPVWVHLHGSEKPANKLAPRAKRCFLLGHIGESIYTVWDPEKDTIFNTSDVIFDETSAASANAEPIAQTSASASSASSTPSDGAETHIPAAEESPEYLQISKGYKKVYVAHKISPTSPHDAPRSYKQATTGPDADKWKAAMQKEFDQLTEKGCWRLVRKDELPPNASVIPGHWVFKKKELPGVPLSDDYKAKARWVIRGNYLDKDFMESYAPVVNEETTKLMEALSITYGWHTKKCDAILAFLNGKIEGSGKRIFMNQVLGKEQGPKGVLVCELLQSLYGLTPSARIWYDTLDAAMRELGFKTSQHDAGLWIHSRIRNLYVTSHVDDFKVHGRSKEDCDWFLTALGQKFDINDVVDNAKYLGVDVHRDADKGTTFLSQKDYAEDLVASFGLADAHPVKLPYDPGLVIDDEFDDSVDSAEYARGTGSLNWLATKTRVDLARTVGILSKFNARPTKKAWGALKHALRYVKGTTHYGITYTAPQPGAGIDSCPIPKAYSDADWGGPLTGNRRSVSGYVFMLAGGPIAWKSINQTSVATSSNESEFMAASEAARQALHLQWLIEELRIYDDDRELPTMTLHLDNQGAVALCKRAMPSKGSKHIEIRHHFVREKYRDGQLLIGAIPTKDMAADGLTKPLRTDSHYNWLKLIGFG